MPAPSTDYTLMADAVGLPMIATPTGVELSNGVSRRIVHCETGVSKVRCAWAIKEASAEKGVRIEYSLDGGLTWVELIPDSFGNGESNALQQSDLIPLPNDAAAAGAFLVRVMCVGPLLSTETLTYVVLTTTDL